MEEQISKEQILEFSEVYNSNSVNKIIENTITRNGLEDACIDRNIIIENVPVFNIELPESKRSNQKDSSKCWIYAGLNMIKHDVASNLNIDLMEFELSNNYIAFFDKLEKSNNVYENIIKSENTDIDYIRDERMLDFCVTEGGYYEEFSAIVNKYGIVPYSIMPDYVEGLNCTRIDTLYTEKVKKDILKLIVKKKSGDDIEKLRSYKYELVKENYIFLSKILGEPCSSFTYEYKDKNNNYFKYTNITPIEFKNKFLTLNLNEFVQIGNVPMYNKEFYKMYVKKYIANVHKFSNVKFLNLPIEDLKALTINQLKHNIPVWMGAHVKKYRDKNSGVLDLRLYNYKETLGLDELTKEESLNLFDIEMHHAMTFVGVNLIDGKPEKWKVEDSYGKDTRFNGYYIMNDNFFDKFVLSVVINKKYLSNEQLKLLEQEPIKYEVDFPV